jgi:hypothetical protein
MGQSGAIQELLEIIVEAEHEADDVLGETVAAAVNLAMAIILTRGTSARRFSTN